MKHLFRISTKKSSVWSDRKPKPVYYVATSKEDAKKWAEQNLKEGLSVRAISKLAKQLAPNVFSSAE